jgi:hypothetical protein
MGRIGLAVGLLVLVCAPARAQETPPCTSASFEWGRAEVEVDPGSSDRTPPTMPQITSFVASSHRGEPSRIDMTGTFDADTVSIRVTNSTGYSIVTTPDHLHVCGGTYPLQAQEHFKVVAFDKSGNASEPFETDVAVAGGFVKTHEDDHRDLHGMGILVTIGAIVLAGMELVGLVLIGFARKRAPFSVAGEFLSAILAENVARGVARGYLIKLTVAMVVIIGLLGLHHLNIAILVGPFAIVWLFELFLTRLVIGQFESKIQRLEKRELWIYINGSKLWAPYKIWEKASALPSAGLAKRD